MRALRVLDVKVFMAKLLTQEVFDQFLVSEMMFHTFTKFEISGKLNKDYYMTEELEELGGRNHAKWMELRPIAFQLLKGKKTPTSFHINLMLSEKQIKKVIEDNAISLRTEDVSGLYFHIKYEGGYLFIITGIGLNVFTMDKTLERAWDDTIENYLKRMGIAVSQE